MNKPTKIKLGAIEWNVRFEDVPEYIAEALETEQENLMGATDKCDLTIYVRNNFMKQNPEAIKWLMKE